VNVIPSVRAVSPALASAVPAAARKGVVAVTDSAFAAMLAMFTGVPIPVPAPPDTTLPAATLPAATLPAAAPMDTALPVAGGNPESQAPDAVTTLAYPPGSAQPSLQPSLGPSLSADVDSLLIAQRLVMAVPASQAIPEEQQGVDRALPEQDLPTSPDTPQMTPPPLIAVRETRTTTVHVQARTLAEPQAPEGDWVVEFAAAPPTPIEVGRPEPVVRRVTLKTAAPVAMSDEPKSEQLTVLPPGVRADQGPPQVEAKPADPPPRIQTPVDVDRLMEAIARTASHARDGRYSVTLRLHPENLGEVRLQIRLSGREVSTIMQVSTPDAQLALQERGDMLRQGLDQVGLSLNGFHVSTGNQDRRPRDRTHQEQALSEQRRRSLTPSATTRAGRPVALGRTRLGMLDTLA